MISFGFVVYAISAVCIWYTYSKYYDDPFSFFRFAAFCYSLVLLGGAALILLGDGVFGYKMPIDGLPVIFIDSLCGLLIMHVIAALFPDAFRGGKEGGSLAADSRWALGGLAALSVMALTLFALANGINFGSVDYEYRYEAARGWGAVLVLIPAFLPFVFYSVYNSRGLGDFLLKSALACAIGASTYIVLSGYRQVLIGVIVICCCVAVQRGYIKKWFFFPGMAIFFMLIISLSFLRYAGDSGSDLFDDVGIAAFYYVQGDMFPVDAPMKIREYGSLIAGAPGLNVAMNHLAKLIPRVLWEDKPLILLDAAGYYTQVVVGYARGVTLSPTLLGEGYLMGGRAGFYGVLILGSVLLCLLDIFRRRVSSGAFFVAGSFLYGGFFYVREGVSELLLRAGFILIFFFMYLVIKLMLTPLVKPVR